MSSSSDETTLALGSDRRPSSSQRSGWLSSSVELEAGRIPMGTVLDDRYRIIGLLGRGGMGEVYRADDLRLGQPVALKFLPAAVSDDPMRLAQFHNEVRIARQVSHRNVCRVYDIGEAGGRIFLTMEFVDGEDLATLLKRIGRLPQDKAVEVARQICAGLAAAHEQGVMHRDLKPANIMLDGEGRVRITDFGLAGVADEIHDVRSGTPAYMAPEQLAGRDVSIRSDIFTLGLVLYEIFTGRRAFEAQTVAELLRKHDQGLQVTPTSAVRELDPAIERVIEHCLSPDPNRRPTSAIAVAAALPGGDPLAAALAAGETPSPEMVAAAGRDDAVPVRYGLTALVAVVGGLMALVVIGRSISVAHTVPLDLPPPVLEDRAKTALGALGYGERSIDAFGALTDNTYYLDWVTRTQSGADRWQYLSSGRTPAVVYWYRTSPRPLVSWQQSWFPLQFDPPLDISGMTLTVLDMTGRVLSFEAIPPQRDGSAPVPDAAATFDWSSVFRVTGLDATSFTPAKPEWAPRGIADVRAAWTGTIPELGASPIRVEAAAYRSRITQIEVLGPWSRASRMEASPVDSTRRSLSILAGFIVLSLIAGAIVLARRNLALGRGDTSGANRVAVAMLVISMSGWIIGARHVFDFDTELVRFYQATGWSLLWAGWFWLLYISIEPWVRRNWPTGLISWNRLLTRGIADPLVGRDILVGAICGTLFTVYMAIIPLLPGVLGLPPAAPLLETVFRLNGLQALVLTLTNHSANAVLNGVFFVFLYVVLRSLLRWRAFVAAGFVLLFSVFLAEDTLISGAPWASVAVTAAFSVAFFLVLLRFGLLTLIVAIFVWQSLSATAWTSNLAAWYGRPMFIVGMIVLAVGIYGFYRSRAGEPLFGRSLLQE